MYASYGGKGPLILGVSWSFCAVCTILAVLRTISATRKPAATSKWDLRWDYVWFMVSYILTLVAQILLTISVLYGLGNHDSQIGYNDGATAALYNWTAEIIVIFAIGLAKVAIIAFILMIQGPTRPKMKWVLHFIWITNMLVNIDQIVLIMLQCKPLEAFWDYRIESADCSFRPTTNRVGFFQGGWGAATDFALAIYPVFLYWSLQMSRRLKLGLFVLTGGGIVVGVAAVMKTIYIRVIQVTGDINYAFADLVIWLWVEIWLVLILSSIPPLRQLFVRYYSNFSNTVVSKSRGTGNASSKNTGDGPESNNVPLNVYPGGRGYKVDVKPNSSVQARDVETDYGDNDSLEAILGGPGERDNIWVTKSYTVRRDTEAQGGRGGRKEFDRDGSEV